MTDDRHGPLPPLPPELRSAMAELRERVPSSAFDARLTRRLAEADADSARASSAARVHRGQRRAALFAIAPALAGAALVVYAAVGDAPEGYGTRLLERAEEMDVALEAEGPTWVHLDLATEHHEGADTVVHVHAADNVAVHATDHARGLGPADCADAMCKHEFEHLDAHPERRPVKIGLHKPGRYAIRVEHKSDGVHVREHFIVNAR